MKFINLADLKPEQYKAFADAREPTPEERAEIVRRYKEQFTAAELQQYTELDPGTSFEEFLEELEEEQRRWDENHK